jgi:transcriptional regulator with XRE-family HTH domain
MFILRFLFQSLSFAVDRVNIVRYNLTEVSELLNERLEKVIKYLGIKKMYFAEKIGFTPSYVSMILNGKKMNPSVRFFESVARAFRVNIEWLRTGEGEMFAGADLNLSDEDAALVEKYRALPPSDRKTVETIVDAMLIKSVRENDAGKP